MSCQSELVTRDTKHNGVSLHTRTTVVTHEVAGVWVEPLHDTIAVSIGPKPAAPHDFDELQRLANQQRLVGLSSLQARHLATILIRSADNLEGR